VGLRDRSAAVRARERSLDRTAERSAGALPGPLGLVGDPATRYPDAADLGAGFCPRARRSLRLLTFDGRRVAVPCKSPNTCEYCGRVVAFENAGVLRLDAETSSRMPSAVLTLTTRDQLEAGAYRVAVASFWRAFRKKWGPVEYCGFVEWTSGKGPRSGGVRRQHEHFLLKGLDLVGGAVLSRAPGQFVPGRGRPRCSCGQTWDCVECWTRDEWRKLSGAWVVNVTPLRSVAGATAYLALHHDKASQKPPPGWGGKRFRPSKGYFDVPVAELREEVRIRRAEKLCERRGEDPATVRPRRLLDAFTAVLVPHVEDDGHAGEGVGSGYSADELGELADLAQMGQARELPEDRYSRLLVDSIRAEAYKRIEKRRQRRRDDPPLALPPPSESTGTAGSEK
jgi:hypothetical protein